MKKIALVTGASSGIGQATTKLLAEHGYFVFAVARRTDRLNAIANENIEAVTLDVTDEPAVKDCINHIKSSKGRIDLLVNNAGFAQLGAIECVSIEAVKRQFDVNFFGYARCIQGVLPLMRAQKSGWIINISSAVGQVSMAAFGWYAATKHAIEAMSDALRSEVLQFGIEVTVIEPGVIDTEILPNQMNLLQETPHLEEYRSVIDGVSNLITGDGAQPEIIAEAILKAATSGRPRIRHALPLDAKIGILARKVLGDRLYAFIVRKVMKI